MYIWVIQRDWKEVNYGEHRGAVIIAPNKESVYLMASRLSGDQDSSAWRRDDTSLICIGEAYDKTTRVVFSEFLGD